MMVQANYAQIPLQDYAESASFGYSMCVVLDRALPLVGDCLKPIEPVR